MRYDELQKLLLASTTGDWLYEDSEGVFTFKPDLLVTIRRVRQQERRQFHEPWAQGFPDKAAFLEQYDLLYGSALVERFNFVSVDGLRVDIPFPKSSDDLRISAWQLAIARAIDRNGQLHEYLHRAGITAA